MARLRIQDILYCTILPKYWGRSQTMLTIFCPLLTTYVRKYPPHVDICDGIPLLLQEKICTVPLPSTYLPYLVNVVCERPLISKLEKKKTRDRTFQDSKHICFVHPIFSSFGFWYFGHFSCMIFFPFFFSSCPSCLAKCKQRLRNIFVFL